jgi:hypothetical protein
VRKNRDFSGRASGFFPVHTRQNIPAKYSGKIFRKNAGKFSDKISG